jgi:hypothetical protein
MALRRPWLRRSSDAEQKQKHRIEKAHPRRTTMPQHPGHEHHPIGCCIWVSSIPVPNKKDISADIPALGSQASAAEGSPNTRPVTDHDKGFITRSGLVGFGGLTGGAVGAVAAWATDPLVAILIGIFAALGAAAALHGLLPKHW